MKNIAEFWKKTLHISINIAIFAEFFKIIHPMIPNKYR